MFETDWGYSVDGLSQIVTVEEYRELCPGLSSTDLQLGMALNAISAAIRNHCGWHVAPVFDCEFIGEGEGRTLVLPSMSVQSVDSLEVCDEPVEEYEWTPSGMVRLKSGAFPDAWRSVKCTYKAGYSTDAIAQVVMQIASNALTASPGVVSERVGDVSVTYNQTGVGITGGVSLLPRDIEMLAPYKLARAW